MKVSEFITEATKETCKYCKQDATQKLIWADGRAYVPICSKHESKARTDIKKNGEFAQIGEVKPI